MITIPRLIDGKRGVLVDLSWPDDKRAHLATFSGISGVEIKQPSRVDAYAQPLFYTPFVASDIDGDGVGDVATLCDSQGFEGVRAWSSKSLEMIWAVRGIVLREATTFATLRCNRSGAPAAFEFAIGSVYYDSSMAEDFEPDSAVVLLDPRSGTERRRFKEESYLGISYSNHIKPTQAPERK